MLWFLGFFAAMPISSMALSRALDLPTRDDLTFVLVLSGLLGLGWVCCLWHYLMAQVRMDADGIRQLTPFGWRMLLWQDVRGYFPSGDDEFTFGSVVGENTYIRFWMGIGDVEELKEEITRRAAHCERAGWKKDL